MKKSMSMLLVGFLLCFTGAASAEYPDKPVSFVVPWPPGDLEDVLTRMIADDFQATYGVAAAVVNKPGGGGGPFPGAMEVANAPADGSMVGSFVIGVPVVGPKLGIDGLTAETFEPLGIFLTYPFVIATSGDAPYSSMQELAVHAKSNKVALGHFGDPLTPTQVTKAGAKALGFEWASDAAFDMLDCNTLASGDVDVINTTIQLILPCLDKVKILASVTASRISKAPDAPTMGEIVPELDIFLWNGLFVTKGTPQDVRDKIISVAKKSMLSDKAQQVAKDTGAQVYWMDASESAGQINKDIATMATIGSLLGG
ncbi:MAG: tripartite tricarboxylate transporter substrate binding protein [Acidiferrobacteraceae bacterium]|jgi:tripartite-type tricarboxylate transporter receptor subunit TctC|nr:tripartite tricarboxylate transporter substrate binding protein [Acidiferrobacteraceae bacterium]MBT3639420.1 tripartite tricarboxylate transporter substrate binding protein [Acidiferrobacteraceae bacterium]MBT3770766.1 tripartite tricarboxylate transporter substrate binding protein [Acidiferrobacteraceae bacterium]MBT3974768.1 tripartite tricarboxylate transporter substrate binding protein [Acidiferrobacteraceae bacterium]MBT4393814.1 tripartite tricarboxylate transporter substrate binding 